MEERPVEIEFPQRGIAVDAPLTDQQPLSTRNGVNVRFHEALTNRGRGGTRAGISRFIDAQANGENAIQMLNTVVRTDGNALGWEFEGEDFEFDGLYLTLDLTGIAGDSQPTGGGGGYQPSASFQDNRIRLSLAASHSTRDIDNSITITATVTDDDGAPVNGRVVEIHTSRGGRDGDHDRVTSSGAGTAVFTIQNDRDETVTYMGTIRDALGRPETRSRNAVACIWTNGIVYLHGEARTVFNSGDPNPRSVTLSTAIAVGDLIVVGISASFDAGSTVSVTDTLGNTYLQAGSYLSFQAGPLAGDVVRFSIWYTVSTSAGACAVRHAISDTLLTSFQSQRVYSGSKASPLESTASGTQAYGGAVVLATAGTISVSVPNSMVFALWSVASGGSTVSTPQNGFVLLDDNATAHLLDADSSVAVEVAITDAFGYGIIAASFNP